MELRSEIQLSVESDSFQQSYKLLNYIPILIKLHNIQEDNDEQCRAFTTKLQNDPYYLNYKVQTNITYVTEED